MASCKECDNTGWKPVEVNGVRRLKPCDHGVAAAVPTAVAEAFAEAVESLFTPEEKQLRGLIVARRGRAAAISAGEIAAELWPDEYAGADWRKRENLRRTVTAAVEKLRRIGRLPIAAAKDPPGGYFVAITPQECAIEYRRHRDEGIAQLVVARLFRPDADLVRELEGQLGLATEARRH